MRTCEVVPRNHRVHALATVQAILSLRVNTVTAQLAKYLEAVFVLKKIAVIAIPLSDQNLADVTQKHVLVLLPSNNSQLSIALTSHGPDFPPRCWTVFRCRGDKHGVLKPAAH